MRTIRIATVALALALVASAVREARAEVATQEEAELVCRNWLSYMVDQQGDWAGEAEPEILDVQEIVVGDTVLAWCFSVAPHGYVVVPVLKEMPPIKAYSEEYRLDVDQTGGFPQLLREVLEHRSRAFINKYGSLDASQPRAGDVVFDRVNRQEWDRFLVEPEEFKADLQNGRAPTLAGVGALLSTAWHQGQPYNNLCPMGDGGRTVVGCVATATAQIMKYHNWPPVGSGNHSYNWNGDQSCGGSVGGGVLSADFADSYDWVNMPDHCSGGCSVQQQNALAELSYEVGVAFDMDYGRCGSGTSTSYALNVLPQYFGYASTIDKEDRSNHTPATWFEMVQEQLASDRPVLYRIFRHAIVCDGWRDTGGLKQVHMNYGWADSHTAWYTVDNLYCDWAGCDPMVEYMIRNIQPGGACCDVLTGICRDNISKDDCFPDQFTPGVLCANLVPPCAPPPGPDARMIILLDRTGSMEQAIRAATGNTRCVDALDQAYADVIEFCDGGGCPGGPVQPGRSVAVWTFTTTNDTPPSAILIDDLTGGFVNQASALLALDGLGGIACTGWTPLAQAICQAANEFPAGLSAPDKILAISSDGGENESVGPCEGSWSVAGPPPSGNYDSGSWQQKAWAELQGKAVVHLRYWGALARGGDGEVDAETGRPRDPGVSDEVFFLDLAGSTGGTYEYVDDADPDYPGPTGACCVADGSCVDAIAESICVNADGRYQGDGTRCEDVVCIPTVAEWGLVTLTLLLLTGGKLHFGRRRPARETM